MDGLSIHQIALFIQHSISLAGTLIILSGIVVAIYQYMFFLFNGQLISQGTKVNNIRLNLGRILVLGLEFIVAADLIGTTTTPDYYSIGIVAIIVLIRTVLSYTLNREISGLSREK